MAGFDYTGSTMDVFTWADGVEAWEKTFAAHGSQYAAHLAQLVALLQRLGDTGRLRPPDQIHAQGDEIYAVKSRFGFRAYGWFDNLKGRRCFVIGHVRLKKEDKADKNDLKKCAELKAKFRKQK